ncbi:cytosolic iron-sulfur protein assembly protein CIAO1-B, putative (macronuclear) [Tetrahymena thermophila SB210]|uniref:Probable cytosolic iron-sulfur protein assembly protein CIAO1 homolog n=1 Tax=Tetrahymena thermophila (strain SB210) TaxID=312017 RepID=Q23K67_TETTS|nr:cytosolic iron-sulfur protein assembly protein CIAO1-B, putative [Tetrahymena thermophila SB210]EAR96976.2 cytosolic iron-sulfur protein assembly protein CIAO1-B, putative [Tetrahymena thermophila SB210]|eukprot:XP_001017221.2 cytosolic iron-sulfur protein assembly protein CIAO1-B, putative [Tetrahymena thermophila SB210]
MIEEKMEEQKEFVKCIGQLNGHTDKIWSVSWHPTLDIFATCSSDKTIKIWGLKENSENQYELKQTISDTHERTIRTLAFSPDGMMLACGSFDSTISIYALNNGSFEFVSKLEGHEHEVKCVAWDSEGKFLASCSRDKTVWVWDYENGFDFSCYSVIDAHTQDVKHVKWIPGTNNLASTSFDDKLKLWEQEDDDWKCSATYSNHSATVWCVEFSKTGQYMASCGDDKQIKVYKKNENGAFSSPYIVETTIKNAHARTIYSLSFSEDATFLASVGADNTLNVYQKNMYVTTFEGQDNNLYELLEKKVNCHFADINCVAFHPSKDILVTVSDDRQIKLWSVEINL